MLILGIDASGHTASTALLEDGVVLAEYSLNIGLTHSQTLLPMVAEIFSRTGKKVTELSAIAVSAGPGSFTGLRIGAATAKGIALPYAIPLVSVSTLEALAANASDRESIVHPIMDARRQQVYTGAFRNGKLLGEEEAISVEERCKKVNATPGRHLFLGDAVPVYKETLEKLLNVDYGFVSPQNLLQHAASIAVLGAEKFAHGEGVPGDAFRLSYIRAPQAERERAREGLREYDITHEHPDEGNKVVREGLLAAPNYEIRPETSHQDANVPANP